ncbi:hypothetical protein V8C37DRAFT_386537 [Trichoderma ceciliae]
MAELKDSHLEAWSLLGRGNEGSDYETTTYFHTYVCEAASELGKKRGERQERQERQEEQLEFTTLVTQKRFVEKGPNAEALRFLSFLVACHTTPAREEGGGGRFGSEASDSTRRLVSLVTALGQELRHFCMKKACLTSHKSGRWIRQAPPLSPLSGHVGGCTKYMFNLFGGSFLPLLSLVRRCWAFPFPLLLFFFFLVAEAELHFGETIG